jgi:hypothetical protein
MRYQVYELLYLLNRNLEETRALLERIQNSPRITKYKFKAYLADVEYLRAEATQDVLEVMNDVEIDEMSRWSKEKKVYEDSVRDLDDVYFEVEEREEQRRQQGLPSLIGILPRNYQGSPSVRSDETRPEPTSSGPAHRLNARSREQHGTARHGRSRSKARNSTRRRQSRGTIGGRDGEE